MNEVIHCFLFCINYWQKAFDEKDDDIKEVFDAARNGFEDVNERLKNQGCDEINMPKVMGRMQYNIFYERHPDFLRRNVPTPTPTHTHSGSGGGRPTP